MTEDLRTGTEPPVIVRHDGALLRITLNRPRAINALTRRMAELVRDAIRGAAETPGIAAIWLDGAGERGFCGGGDVKAMSSDGLAGALAFLAAEYRADLATARSELPVIGVMDGITMGGGIGLTGHSALRVVTERSRLAMPETRIGIVPDVGGHLLLARAPGRLGEMLAISSGSMGAGDALMLGFADHFVPSDRLADLAGRLAAGDDPESAARAIAAESLDGSTGAAPVVETPVLGARVWFDPIADAALGQPDRAGADGVLADPVGAAERLVRGLETSAHPRARALGGQVRELCPTSVAVTLAQLARTRRDGLGLAEVLADDYRVLGRLLARPDFTEGVRAQLIDKDGSPRWAPDSIEGLDRAEIARILAPHADGEEPLDLD